MTVRRANVRFHGAIWRLAALLGGVGALTGALAWASAEPFALIARGGHLDYESALAAATATAAWLVVTWFAGCLLLCLLGRLPGALGRCAAALARRVTPALVRRLLEATLGATLAVTATTGHSAQAASGPALGAGTAATGPGVAAKERLPSPDRPVTTPKKRRPHERAQTVVVRRGDSLWSLAAAQLPGRPSSAEVARAWPRWYAANRGVVGADPDLIHPGQRLRAPAS
ncbi:MAG: hypothetical protein GEV10_01260 [Streptosporangiales bacterium]|nr:hypothetical protein [Streptosporangiales bacterium]